MTLGSLAGHPAGVWPPATLPVSPLPWGEPPGPQRGARLRFQIWDYEKKFPGKNSPIKSSVPPIQSQNPQKNFRENLHQICFPIRIFLSLYYENNTNIFNDNITYLLW